MKNTFKKIGLIGKYLNQDALQTMRDDLLHLAQHLTQQGYLLTLESLTEQYAHISEFATQEIAQLVQQVDVIIVMGGDGTMLSVARALVNSEVPLIGINRGRFGFLTDIRAEEMLVQIDRILAGDFLKESRMLLSAEVIRQNQVVFSSVALNDVVIKSGVRLIELEVSIDEKFVYKQRSDGLIVSTPTGTTAYALSAGGPILHANLEAISLVPISPHTLSNRPIAVSSQSKIQVVLEQLDEAQLSCDGQSHLALQLGDKINIARAEKTISILHPSDYCYFDRLRNKLNWS